MNPTLDLIKNKKNKESNTKINKKFSIWWGYICSDGSEVIDTKIKNIKK
jgi:hypothetical protein